MKKKNWLNSILQFYQNVSEFRQNYTMSLEFIYLFKKIKNKTKPIMNLLSFSLFTKTTCTHHLYTYTQTDSVSNFP